MFTNEVKQLRQNLTRRELLRGTAGGLAGAAFASLLAHDSTASEAIAEQSLADRPGHFPAKAKHVIFVHLVGGPSHLDLFEPKSTMAKYDGKDVPAEYIEGQRFAFIRGVPKVFASPYKFRQHGESGLHFSELLPHLATVADELAVAKSVHTELINHAPAQLFMQTGFGRFGRPCVGSWTTYGLGSPNEELPGFVVLVSGGSVPGGGSSLWGSGFLPTVHQGVEFRSSGDPVLFLSNPRGIDRSDRRRMIDSINHLNEMQMEEIGDPEIVTRMAQYEMAFKMQASVPELSDLSQESTATLKEYGAKPGGSSFANNCLLARRLVERDVRFVQLYDDGWDHHGGIQGALPRKCKDVDQPLAALIRDLKQRGLLDDTLVVWSSEFGRTPMAQGDRKTVGRDHHKDAFCAWMAGGGVKGGTSYGATDELGYYPTEDPMSVHDLHATILHLLGINHKQLTYKFQGREFRLTDVAGEVAEKMLA